MPSDSVRRVCEIARDLQRPGAPSLHALLTASAYREVRAQFDVAVVQAVVDTDPVLIDDWLRFSADKRTRGGWAFSEDGRGEWVVSRPFPELGHPTTRTYRDAVVACADYILAELDHWNAVDLVRTSREFFRRRGFELSFSLRTEGELEAFYADATAGLSSKVRSGVKAALAEGRIGPVFADLRAPNGELLIGYGTGLEEGAAADRAVQRWRVEQGE